MAADPTLDAVASILTDRGVEAIDCAIVLGTGGYTYDRFVRDRSFCQFDEFADPAWVPARDTPQCFVGYRCKNGSPWDD